MTGSTGDRSRYATTGVIIAIVAVITWIVGRQLIDRQAAAMAAAEGPINFGAPLMTAAEIGAILFGMAVVFAMARVVRAYKQRRDQA